MNAHGSLKGHEKKGCEMTGNTQEMILSHALQGQSIETWTYIFPTEHVHSFENGKEKLLKARFEAW